MGNTPPESGERAYNIQLDETNKLGEGSFAVVYKAKRLVEKLTLRS